jgi:hypothetical protein
MSTLKVTNIQDTSGGNSLTTQQLYNGSAKAWVNFDGTGTYSPNPSVTKIRASYNVSSVFKNGTGDYTVNFATAMPDTNYTPIACSNYTGIFGYAYGGTVVPGSLDSSYSVSSVNLQYGALGSNSAYGGEVTDSKHIFLAVFR